MNSQFSVGLFASQISFKYYRYLIIESRQKKMPSRQNTKAWLFPNSRWSSRNTLDGSSSHFPTFQNKNRADLNVLEHSHFVYLLLKIQFFSFFLSATFCTRYRSHALHRTLFCRLLIRSFVAPPRPLYFLTYNFLSSKKYSQLLMHKNIC